MIFAIQRFLEDHFVAARHVDRDQYAIALANLYDRNRAGASKEDFLRLMRKVSTDFFTNNRLPRKEAEQHLLERLDRRFKKKIEAGPPPHLIALSKGLVFEQRVVRRAKRRTIRLLLERFRHAVELVAWDMFWDSRQKHRLKRKPESIAQGGLALMLKGLDGTHMEVLREIPVGTGYVDVGVFLSKLHVVELKVLKTGALTGPQQLDEYLRRRADKEGWLVVIDARRPGKNKTAPPPSIPLSGGRLAHVISIDINPIAPSKIAAYRAL
jgi:hypothetical protein